MDFLTGFESTFLPDCGIDILETTRHAALFREDLQLVHDAGIRSLRYPVPWHRIEARRGEYDWKWMDQVMETLADCGFDPIVDMVHHTSFPAWLVDGFNDPEFSELYTGFVLRFAQRYPWVKKYTPFNEPFTTALFCGHHGLWRPYAKGPEGFIRMAVNIAKAVCLVDRALTREVPGLQIVHVDTCELHSALDAQSVSFAAHLNERRFLLHDLILGRVTSAHPLYDYLIKYGFNPDDVSWFHDNAGRIDVLGLDYYAHAEAQYGVDGTVAPALAPLGFAAVARQYVNRYHLPVMLAETNIRGYVADRLSWLKYTVEQSEVLVREGVDFRGFCWFPFVDSTDWDSLLCRADEHIDPVGIYWLDEDRKARYPSELSAMFSALVRGEITSAGLPAYRFQEPVATQLAGYMPQMQHWQWRDPLRG